MVGSRGIFTEDQNTIAIPILASGINNNQCYFLALIATFDVTGLNRSSDCPLYIRTVSLLSPFRKSKIVLTRPTILSVLGNVPPRFCCRSLQPSVNNRVGRRYRDDRGLD